jgi:cellulose synthase/poly-beta-1,6-N-acetylglucosamine synthase-like glycosyltransferase
MSTPAASLPAGTPREVASSITTAWLLYFAVHTVIMIVVNLALGSVYTALLSSLASNPWLMRIGYMAVGLVINAPISFVLFQWAVRSNVVPAILSWAQPAEPAAQ